MGEIRRRQWAGLDRPPCRLTSRLLPAGASEFTNARFARRLDGSLARPRYTVLATGALPERLYDPPLEPSSAEAGEPSWVKHANASEPVEASRLTDRPADGTTHQGNRILTFVYSIPYGGSQCRERL